VPPGADPVKVQVTLVNVVVICVDSKKEATGAIPGIIPLRVNGVPLPHPFTGVTVIVPVPVPTATTIELVVPDPLHPIPATVQV
jgi:hypothetical protein